MTTRDITEIRNDPRVSTTVALAAQGKQSAGKGKQKRQRPGGVMEGFRFKSYDVNETGMFKGITFCIFWGVLDKKVGIYGRQGLTRPT